MKDDAKTLRSALCAAGKNIETWPAWKQALVSNKQNKTTSSSSPTESRATPLQSKSK